MKTPEESGGGKPWRGALSPPRGPAAAAIALGTQLVAGMVFFAGIGWYIDRRRGGEGQAFTLAGIFMGLLYGGYEVWKVVRMISREPPEGGPGPGTGANRGG